MSDSKFAALITAALCLTMLAAGYAAAKIPDPDQECLVEVARNNVETHQWVRPCKEVE
jgi:hypothetical protein